MYEESTDRGSLNIPKTKLKRVVIIGGGFAGIEMLNRLKKVKAQLVLIDENNYHCFQPLLYQVASGGLEPNSIAFPLRKLTRFPDFYFRVAKVLKIHTEKNVIETNIGFVDFDYLVLATGTSTNYFGMDDVAKYAFPMKSLPDALDLRSILLQSLEQAVVKGNPVKKSMYTDFVIVGGGPTGVELSGALAELKRFVIKSDYRELDRDQVRVILIEMDNRLLPAMSEEASHKAKKYLEDFGVEVLLNTSLKSYDGTEAKLSDGSNITTNVLIWTAGVTAVYPDGLVKAEKTKSNRIKVDSYNRVKGYNHIYAAGDIASMVSDEFPEGHPQLASVAKQQGIHLGKNFRLLLKNKPMKAFNYNDPGLMATIGRNKAVADLKNWKIQGFFAWFLWMAVHITFLIGFRNKALVLMDWVYNYLTYDRAARLIIRPVTNKN